MKSEFVEVERAEGGAISSEVAIVNIIPSSTTGILYYSLYFLSQHKRQQFIAVHSEKF